jgi:hypothetical protein
MTNLFDLTVQGAGQLPLGRVLDGASAALLRVATRVVPTKVAFACDPFACVRNCAACGCGNAGDPFCCNSCLFPESPCC